MKKKVKFSYDEEVIYSNMEKVLESSTLDEYQQGMNWYPDAHQFCKALANMHKTSVMKVAGIVSAFSPLKSWNINKILAKDFLINKGIWSMHTELQTQKAINIYNNEDDDRLCIEQQLGGLKTINFFNNIYCPSDENYVTIDRHHLYICTGVDVQSCTKKQYEFIKHHTIEYSKSVNMTPCSLQATLWVTWKRIKKCQLKRKELGTMVQ